MNRRDAFKMAAAAAAGSVAGKLEVAPEQMNEEPDVPVIDMHEALRLQSAIELGDRTAEELPQAEFSLGISSLNKLWCASFISFQTVAGVDFRDDRFDIRGRDPDPLTAVQKAREAALEWVDSHNGEGPRELGAPWATPY